MVVNRGSLARVPDSADDQVCFVLWHLDEIHRKPVFARSEGFSWDGGGRTYQTLYEPLEVQEDLRPQRISPFSHIHMFYGLLKSIAVFLHGLQCIRLGLIA